jgi:hypothetical protein
MLYEMGRRYDEWKGENYDGTSLRGAMKGWHKHGVASRKEWPFDPKKPGSLTQKREEDAKRRPLGAYFRVVDRDVSHMQAAVVLVAVALGYAVYLVRSGLGRGGGASRERPSRDPSRRPRRFAPAAISPTCR